MLSIRRAVEMLIAASIPARCRSCTKFAAHCAALFHWRACRCGIRRKQRAESSRPTQRAGEDTGPYEQPKPVGGDVPIAPRAAKGRPYGGGGKPPPYMVRFLWRLTTRQAQTSRAAKGRPYGGAPGRRALQKRRILQYPGAL